MQSMHCFTTSLSIEKFPDVQEAHLVTIRRRIVDTWHFDYWAKHCSFQHTTPNQDSSASEGKSEDLCFEFIDIFDYVGSF
jgi:dsRNA-specific ribonuclease